MHTKHRSHAFRHAALVAAMLAASAVQPAFAATSEVATPIKPIKPSKIILVGDSTVAVQSGWGSSFCAEHVTSTVACVNLARGGRSSSSYIEEGSWTFALREAGVSGYVRTWVLIQFGHNDQPGKPGRSTDLATQFPDYLKRYVTEARAAGALPVLVTPLTRRQFSKGQLKNDLAPWADAMKKVATELDVPLIDLNTLSSSAVQSMGPAEANKFAQRPQTDVGDQPPPPPPVPGMAQPKTAFDYTHLDRAGADYFATMVTVELARKIPDMRPLLIP
jgi:lysophospholipase L1-like esterase